MDNRTVQVDQTVVLAVEAEDGVSERTIPENQVVVPPLAIVDESRIPYPRVRDWVAAAEIQDQRVIPIPGVVGDATCSSAPGDRELVIPRRPGQGTDELARNVDTPGVAAHPSVGNALAASTNLDIGGETLTVCLPPNCVAIDRDVLLRTLAEIIDQNPLQRFSGVQRFFLWHQACCYRIVADHSIRTLCRDGTNHSPADGILINHNLAGWGRV